MELSERGGMRDESWKMQSNRKPYMNPYKIMILQPGVSEEIKFRWCKAIVTMDIIKAATVKEKKIMMEDDPLRLPIFCIRLQAFILRFVLIVLAPFQKDCL